MKSIKLPGFTIEIGKGQPEYNVLHAKRIEPQDAGTLVICFELTDEEVAEIIKTKKIYYTRLTFHQKFQPMRISVEMPE